MADSAPDMAVGADAAAAGGKGAWTEAEKYSLLMQIIKQLGNDKPVKFDQIALPGRTAKAMTHVWQKIRNDAATIVADPKAAPVTARVRTPKAAKTTTPKKKKADGDAEAESPTKRRKATPKKKNIKEKAEETEAATKAKHSPSDESVEKSDVEEESKAEENDDDA